MSDETDRLSGMSGDDEAAYYEALVKGETGTYDDWEEERPRREAARTRQLQRLLPQQHPRDPIDQGRRSAAVVRLPSRL